MIIYIIYILPKCEVPALANLIEPTLERMLTIGAGM